MAYENLCMYCFKDLNGEVVCPHCGGDSQAAVPQIQLLPGTLVYNSRFLIGRALGQDSGGIVYNALDTRRGGTIRIREYLPRNCAERLNDGGVVPVAGMEEAFETGMRKLRASVESVEDPRQRHFYFEENGTAYIAQRKNASAPSTEREAEEDDGGSERKRLYLYIAIAAAVVLVVAVGAFLFFKFINNPTDDQTTVLPLSSPSASASTSPLDTVSPSPSATATFSALVDPELNWMDFTQPTAVPSTLRTASPTQVPTVQGNQNYPTVNGNSTEASVRELQGRLARLGWLSTSQTTGKYDDATREAVKAFQRYVNEHCSPAEKLVVDGIAGQKTQQWLYNASVSLTKPTPTPAPKVTARPSDGSISSGSPATEVRSLQNKLIALGLLPSGSADGRYGSATQSAVRSFQRRVNELQGYDLLNEDGKADALTRAWLDYYVTEWEQLHRATATPRVTATPTRRATATPSATSPNVDASSSRERIREVQNLLRQVGLLSASDVDGAYGSRTREAVRKFQTWINDLRGERTLEVSGVVDPLTERYLKYCVENGRVYDLPTGSPATAAPTTQAPTFEPGPEVTEVPPEQQAGGDGITPTSPKESIEFMQEMLSVIGLLDEDQIDGNYGQSSKDAISAFQRSVNEIYGTETLKVTGRCDTDTLRYLQEAYDEGWNLGDRGDEPEPTEAPTEVPTQAPTEVPTEQPTEVPTEAPTEVPTEAPTEVPTAEPIDGVAPESPAQDIQDMQRLLNSVGLLDEGAIDGVYSAATEQAVRYLQIAANAYNGREVLPVTGRCDASTLDYLRIASQRGMDLRELAGLTTPAPTDAPTPVPTEVPTEAPTEIPTPAPTEVAQVGTIRGLRFYVSGQESIGTVELQPGTYAINWAAEGDLQSYYVYLYDGNGGTIKSAEATDLAGFELSTDGMVPGVVYELRVGAMPVNGAAENIYWQSLMLTMPVVETPVPTEAPTPPPSVSAPTITIGSSVYQQDGVPYISDSTAIFSWMADGQVESYTVNITYQDGTSYSLGTTTDTSRTVNTDQLAPGMYKLYVGARPVGGGEDSIVWSELAFAIPQPEVVEPQTEATPEPVQPAAPHITRVDANSSAEDIQNVQMALYGYGLLDASSVQPGALDAVTLQAVATFQQRANELYGLNLAVIDPTIDAYIDEQTLDALLYQNLDLNLA